MLFVATLGWNVAGPAGAAATLIGIMLPSSTLALWATRWGARRRETRGVRAFTAGMAPLTIGLLLLVALTVAVMLRTRLGPIWMVGAGMLAGALGWV